VRNRSISAAIATILAIVGIAVVNVSPAAADAKGCTVYDTIVIRGYPLPKGTYCATVVGSGRWVGGLQGEFYAPNICNWDVTAEFFDNRWNWKRTYASGHNYGCNYGTAWAPYIPVNSSISALTGTSTGYMCSTFRVAWQRVTSVCHYIH
jgi:hypothetical protein